MQVIKFGGRSLANKGVKNVTEIIKNKLKNKEEILVVVSARGNTTNQLEEILELARSNQEWKSAFQVFKNEQVEPIEGVDFKVEFELLQNIFEGVKLLEDYSEKVKDLVLAQGEILAAKMVTALLANEGVNAAMIDSRQFLKTDAQFGNAQINWGLSEKRTKAYFSKLTLKTVPVVTGFIASTIDGQTTTLGRNGSNYSAALLASFLKASELQNFTHVDGVYTANPDIVNSAKILDEISYQDANELVNLGTSILHAKTIEPLVQQGIPLRVLNTFNPNSKGTLIHDKNDQKGIKSISVNQSASLIQLTGKNLIGKPGVDARIFSALEKKDISIGIISQGSSERGLGFVVAREFGVSAVDTLKSEFSLEREKGGITKIEEINDVAVISIVGEELNGFATTFNRLVDHEIELLLINNTISGKNISIVVNESVVNKAVNVIHNEIFGISKRVNLAIFGKGTVGGSLIEQLLENQEQIERRKGIRLNIFAIAGQTQLLLNENGVTIEWKNELANKCIRHESVQQVIDYATTNHLENLVAIDNTANAQFVENYIPLVENGFDLISSNKIANTIDFGFYQDLRKTLKIHRKKYLYETNVGAGLPLIDTIKLLHDSGENITKIRGVFSGTLSYLFNHFSAQEVTFSSVLKEAIDAGFTEPDPREDLCGNDVGRKLLILARELDLENEFEEVKIENLIPENMRTLSVDEFLNNLTNLDSVYETIKQKQEPGHVLRYIGELSGDLQQQKGKLDVELVSVPENSALGQVKGSDSIFEIYTESYGDNPIVIQGAGAGAEVTARGVFGDLLRVAEQK